ncbi:hypothetical protein Slin15195_G074570 [Septoria linicola]|uniref:Uncharacterized protein n=1 Tax=Septoria linicola TaxID=215465 RepID=A0A9Q9EM67_9PEZI|nr:hypothetical protein Slin14017_G035690 [Septoria linicola]USW54138.1 hypothetical protein Slin15195_G074570 [Septoria linicola]
MASNSETPISPITTRAPGLTVPVPAVNEFPVELDSTPTSPEKVRRSSRAALDEAASSLSAAERERKKKLAETRKADPAVIALIPQTPGAEELEKAGATQDAEPQAGSAAGKA